MGKFWKVVAAVAIVIALGILPFVIPKHKNLPKDPTMIAAKWNLAGYDSYGRPLLDAKDDESANRFEISFDSTSNLAYVSNPIDGTVMRFDTNGQYFYSTKLSKIFVLNGCPPVMAWNNLNGYIKKNHFAVFEYITDSASRNVIVPNEGYRLANPKEATLFEPVQTAVFEDAKDWREYVIDRAGNKLLCFVPTESKGKCDWYSKVLWSVPKNRMIGNARIGKDNYSFSSPSGLCVDGAGNVYVADTGNNRVMKYNSKGEFLSVFQSGFNKPKAVAVNVDGSIVYVCDSGNKRVAAFDTKIKKIILTIGNDKFANPDEVCLDAQGSIWVGDSSLNMLFKFAGTKVKKPGALVFAVNDVLISKKFPKTVLEIEFMRYSSKRNEQAVIISPYAQTINKIPCVPIKFVFENLIKDESRVNLEGFSYVFDTNTKCLTVKVPEFQIGEGRNFEERIVVLCVGSDKATVNGKEVLLSNKVQIVSGSVFVPFADLEKLFDIGVTVKEPKTEPVSKNAVFTLVFPPVK